jgi:hypothetical protein
MNPADRYARAIIAGHRRMWTRGLVDAQIADFMDTLIQADTCTGSTSNKDARDLHDAMSKILNK